MKKIIILLVSCLVLGACNDNHGAKTEAQKVVLNYLLAGTAETRAPYVLNPLEELPRMQKQYGNRDVSWKNYKFQFATEQSGPNGAMVIVQKENSKSVYMLFKENNILKIAWSLSQFMNNHSPTGDTLKKMSLDPDKQKHSLFVSAEASTYYNYAFSNDERTMYSFKLDDSSRAFVHGFCYKNNPECKELFNKLKDYKSCIVSLDAWYPNKVFREYSLRGGCAEIGNIKIQFCI